MLKYLISLFFIAHLTGCGGDAGAGGDTEVQGLAVAGSAWRGALVAAVSVDQSIKTSRLYFYDFATGKVKQVLGAESSGNPLVAAVDDKALLFNRAADHTDVRVLDPKVDGFNPTPATTLAGVTPGDPLDVTSVLANKSALLASGIGGKLQVLDYTTGGVTDVPTDAMKPVAVYRAGAKIYVAHAGLSSLTTNAQADGTQALYVLNAGNDGSLAFADATQKLTASNPTGLVNRASGAALVLGFCDTTMPACVAGADKLTAAGTVTKANTLEALPWRFAGQVVDGPDASQAYAHVRGAGDVSAVVRVDTGAKTATEVHRFADGRLYGIAYDSSARTLFVGGAAELKGSISLYQDDKLVGSFELDGVPYSYAFLRKDLTP